LVINNFYTVLHVSKFVISMQIFKLKMCPVGDVPAIRGWMDEVSPHTAELCLYVAVRCRQTNLR
jgi:hypothetical protein